MEPLKPKGQLLHHFAGGFEDLALFFGQCFEALRGDLVENGIDFAADVGAWFASGFRRFPGHMPGKAAGLCARGPGKAFRPVYNSLPERALASVRDAQEKPAKMGAMRYVIKRDQGAEGRKTQQEFEEPVSANRDREEVDPGSDFLHWMH